MSELNSPVPFLDLSAQFRSLEQEWLDAIRDTGRSGSFILGPNVSAFEKEFADYSGAAHAVGVANGTDALILALRALDIGQGDEVITTPYSFFASSEVIDRVGATPVFVDIEADSFNLDPDDVERRVTERTRAIVVVHLFGYPANMDRLVEIATRHGLSIIEDCAQACGARWGEHRVGSFGQFGCFSFYPTKVLGAYGDGGLLTTSGQDLEDSVRRLRNHGATGPFMHDRIGYNSRLDEIQAAVLRIKLRDLDATINARQQVADWYDRKLESSGVRTPPRPENGSHVFNLYTVRLANRDAVRERFQAEKIGHSLCYPLPLHLQTVYRRLGYSSGDLPVCEQASREALSLPIFPGMTEQQVHRVCAVIASVE